MQFFCGDTKVARKLHYNLSIAANTAYNVKFTEMRE